MIPRIVLIFALFACRAPKEDDPVHKPGDQEELKLEISDVSLEISALVPTVAHVSWTSTRVGDAFIEYGLDGAYDLSTPITEGTDAPAIAVLGLKAGRTYSWRPVMMDAEDRRVEGPVATVDIASPPANMPAFELVTDEEAEQQPGGFFLMNVMTLGEASIVGIVDRDGDWVWWFEGRSDQQIMAANLGRDGESVTWLWTDYVDRSRDNGGLARLGIDGMVLTETPATRAHHHFQELPDGEQAWLCWSDPTDIDVEGEILPLTWDRICETNAGDGEVVFDFLADWQAPWYTCEHMDEGGFIPDSNEWIHANSLLYREADDAYIVMGRYTDSLTKIDRQTGEVLWNLGGPFNDFAIADGTTLFTHAHMSHFWDGGLLVFDNSDHKGDEVSGVVEYRVDEVAKTLEQVWEFRDPLGRNMIRLGDARRLDNGNTLVVWTDYGALEEVTPAGDRVWRATAGPDAKVGRTIWIEDLYQLRP